MRRRDQKAGKVNPWSSVFGYEETANERSLGGFVVDWAEGYGDYADEVLGGLWGWWGMVLNFRFFSRPLVTEVYCYALMAGGMARLAIVMLW